MRVVFLVCCMKLFAATFTVIKNAHGIPSSRLLSPSTGYPGTLTGCLVYISCLVLTRSRKQAQYVLPRYLHGLENARSEFKHDNNVLTPDLRARGANMLRVTTQTANIPNERSLLRDTAQVFPMGARARYKQAMTTGLMISSNTQRSDTVCITLSLRNLR